VRGVWCVVQTLEHVVHWQRNEAVGAA